MFVEIAERVNYFLYGFCACDFRRVWIGCVVLGLSSAPELSFLASAPQSSLVFFDLVPKLRLGGLIPSSKCCWEVLYQTERGVNQHSHAISSLQQHKLLSKKEFIQKICLSIVRLLSIIGYTTHYRYNDKRCQCSQIYTVSPKMDAVRPRQEQLIPASIIKMLQIHICGSTRPQTQLQPLH